MKKVLFTLVSMLMIISLYGCGDSGDTSSDPVPTATPPDLTGEWKQVNSKSDDTWQSAMINEDTIEIYWVTDNGDTTSLYWAGTFVAPQTNDEPYSWESENDRDKTDFALLASGDDSKTFTYENGQLSYSASAMGTTTTVKLEKE